MKIKFPFFLLPLLLIGYLLIPELYYLLLIVLAIHLVGVTLLTLNEITKLWKYGLGKYPEGYLIWKDWFKRFTIGFSLYYFTTYHVFPGLLGQILIGTLYLTLLMYTLMILNFKQS